MDRRNFLKWLGASLAAIHTIKPTSLALPDGVSRDVVIENIEEYLSDDLRHSAMERWIRAERDYWRGMLLKNLRTGEIALFKGTDDRITVTRAVGATAYASALPDDEWLLIGIEERD